MKNITTILLLLLLTCSQVGVAQKFPTLTNEAISKYKEKDFEGARSLIDQSVISIDGKDHAYTWHLRGHIYKHFFSLGIDPDLDNSNREISIESFLKSKGLDTENTFLKANTDGLKPLTNSFWNEAVEIINKRDKNNINLAETKFLRFIKLSKAIGETKNLAQFEIDFYKAYASANRKIIDSERAQNHALPEYEKEFDCVVESYKNVLNTNSEDYTANYNLSINLYNEGAYQIEQMPEEADIIQIIKLQEGTVEIFKMALPFALKADNIRPGRIETVKALRAIYLALNDYKQFDHFDQIVKKILGTSDVKGKIGRDEFQKMQKDKGNYLRIKTEE